MSNKKKGLIVAIIVVLFLIITLVVDVIIWNTIFDSTNSYRVKRKDKKEKTTSESIESVDLDEEIIIEDGFDDDIDVDAEIEKIRTWYYGFKDGTITDSRFVQETWYSSEDCKYTREVYFNNGELYFIFAYAGGEEHRLYFSGDRLIRYIDPNKNTFDYPNADIDNVYLGFENDDRQRLAAMGIEVR